MATEKILNTLPNKVEMMSLCQSLATLDAIIEPEWELRYSSFNSKWDVNEMLATMRNGSGDEYFIFFNRFGVIIKGFDHESEMNICDEPEEVWKGVLDEVPKEFDTFITDKAFLREYTTFCLWRLDSEEVWKSGKIEYPERDDSADGSDWLLFLLDGQPETYLDWAKEYYEKEFDFEDIQSIYQHEPLTEGLVKRLNPDCDLENLSKDIEEIGYPFS